VIINGEKVRIWNEKITGYLKIYTERKGENEKH